MNSVLMIKTFTLLTAYREFTRDHRIANMCSEVIDAIDAELAKPEQNKPLRLSSMYEYGHIHEAAQPEQDTLLIDLIKELHAEIDRLRAKIALNKKADNARELGLDYEPDVTLTNEGDKQEPVAWMTNSEQDVTAEYLFSHVQSVIHNIPLYASPFVFSDNSPQAVSQGFDRTGSHMAGEYVSTSPPRKEWVGLTDEEIEKIVDINTSDDGGFDIWCNGRGVSHAIEAKLKEKNYG